MPLNLIPQKMEISLWKFLIVIALWAFCFQLHVGFIQSQCLQDQQSLLLQLKENLSFDSAFSTKLVFWNSSTDCCVWGGVTCSNGGLVIGLDLSNESISGPMPSFSSAKNLSQLFLYDNGLSGSILSTNWSGLSMLEILDLSNNLLTGAIPKSLFGNPSVRTVSLAHNQFSGIQDGALEFASSAMEYLDLRSNELAGPLPMFISRLRSLVNLQLSSNKLRGPLNVSLFQQMRNLLVLDLSFSGVWINDTGVDLASPPLMVSISLASCQLTGFPTFLKEQAQLVRLDLSNNKIGGDIPDWICTTSFDVLNLSNNSLNGTIPQCLFGMGSLQVLNLRRNNLSGNISDTFSSDCMVQTIDLNGNHLEGRVPRSLANCTSLEVLDLGNNHFYDTFPCYLGTLSTLRVLILRSNRFQGSIGCSNGDFSWELLQIVDLASNNFSGILPVQDLRAWTAMMDSDDVVGQIGVDNQDVYYQDSITTTMKGLEIQLVKILTIFTSIDFSCNNFEGKIPEVIGEFKALYILNFSHNSFTSRIPSSMGNLHSLESLDLSNNNLSGKIPQQLADLNFLAVLNLSRNQLEGRIPSGGQFQTFSEDSFKDNKGLCGVLLNVSCSPNAPPPPRASDDGVHVNWKYISVEIGFVFGLAIVILPLMFWRRWRIWYYMHADVLLSRLFPRWMQRSRNRGSRTSRRAQLRERNKMVGEVALQPRISRVRRGRRTGVIVV